MIPARQLGGVPDGLTLWEITIAEFIAENASEGADHGAAGPMFLAGGKVKPGVIGAHPSFTDLDDGDFKHHTDFRQVYATVLELWLSFPSEKALGGKFETLPLFG